MGRKGRLVIRWIYLGLLFLMGLEQGRTLSSNMKTVVLPPLTVLQVKALMVFCSMLNTTHTATVYDNKTSIYFPVTLAAHGTYRRLFTTSYREMSFSVFPLAQGFHVFSKWGAATTNTDAMSVFTDDMLGTDYVISTWTDCCSATALVLISAVDVSSTTVSITLPQTFSGIVTADGQDYTADFSLQLGLREVVTLTSTSDLSGTLVTGSEAILVQAGSYNAGVQGTTTGQLLETLPPVANQGTTHFGVPTTGRSSDVYRLVSSTLPNTVTIQEDGVQVTTVTLTSSSPDYDYVATNPVIITSSAALLVTQYSSSDDNSGVPPAMTFLPSTDHWSNYYVIKEADGSLTRPEYVSLVTMTSYTSGVRMTYSNETQVYVGGWGTFQSDATCSYVTIPITETFALDHDSSQSFMVIQYGVQASWAYSFVPDFTHTTIVSTVSTSTTSTASTTTTSTTSTSTTSTTSTSTASTSATASSAATSAGQTTAAASSNQTSDSSSWLDDTTSQVLLGVGSSVTVVAVASLVVWRVLATTSNTPPPPHPPSSPSTSAFVSVVTSAPPASSELISQPDSIPLTRVDT